MCRGRYRHNVVQLHTLGCDGCFNGHFALLDGRWVIDIFHPTIVENSRFARVGYACYAWARGELVCCGVVVHDGVLFYSRPPSVIVHPLAVNASLAVSPCVLYCEFPPWNVTLLLLLLASKSISS